MRTAHPSQCAVRHEVWVPSAFTAAVIKRLLPGRVRIVPYPLAGGGAVFGLPAEAVVVLISAKLASSLKRKNPLGTIAAFGDRTDRVLLLKIGDPDHFPADFARITDAVAGAANIRIDTNLYPAATGHALTAAADIVLSLHRSEGFGLVLAEAMLLAKPVITTGWSSNMAFMDADSAALVDWRPVATSDPRQVYHGSIWAEPVQEMAVAHLRHLADAMCHVGLDVPG